MPKPSESTRPTCFRRLSTIPSLRSKALLVGALLLSISSGAQSSHDVPLISGGAGILSSTNQGFTFFQPVVAPVLALPLGSHLLVESRADLRGLYTQNNNTGPFHGTFTATLEYLQADYIVNRHFTVTAGRFLTPFGVYNERLTAFWIRNLQDAPLIFAIGTRTSGSSDGVMLRGSLYQSPKLLVDNTAFFSARKSSGQFEAGRASGDRLNLFFPGKRLEVGGSFERFLQSTPFEKPHRNSAGVHLWWSPWRSPLQVRSEYAHGPHAEGYWVESGYRLSQFGGQDSIIGRFQPLFRMQQTFRLSPGPGDGLPAANTKQADFGFDYYFPHEVRLNTSYSRTFSTVNGNIWDISLTYRFLFPAWRGSR
jgi:hypothetical protein